MCRYTISLLRQDLAIKAIPYLVFQSKIKIYFFRFIIPFASSYMLFLLKRLCTSVVVFFCSHCKDRRRVYLYII